MVAPFLLALTAGGTAAPGASGGGGGGDVLLAEGTLHNLGGSTVGSGVEFSIGHVFKRGDVPVGGSIKLKTAADGAITHQMEYETYWDGGPNADGTLRYSGFKGILPSNITAGGSLGIRLYASSDAPTRTAPASVATVVAAIIATDDYQVRIALSTGADNGTWIGSRDHALGGTLFDASTGYGSNPSRGYRVLSHGPVCTVIEWWSKLYKSPTTTDYHPQLRCHGIVRYYHTSARMQESVRAGMPNMFGAQGVTGITTWENKTPTSVSVYRNTTKLREWLSSDTEPPVIGRACGPWWLDSHADWDWSDATARELFWAQDTTYADTAKVYPVFDLTLTETARVADPFIPTRLNVWPNDFHQAGDPNDDIRIGPVSWATLKAWQSPSSIDARRFERIAVFGLVPTYHIDEANGLRPIKDNPDFNYGPYGDGRPGLGRNNLWGSTSPACQLHDEEYGVWYARYAPGIVESSHWPNVWLYGAVANDERAVQTCIDHNMSMHFNQDGYVGWTYGDEYPGWDETPGTGGYVTSFGGQLRGDGWANKINHMAAMLLRKYEYDYTNLYQERIHMQNRSAAECAFSLGVADYWQSTAPSAFPGIWGGIPVIVPTDPTGEVMKDLDGVPYSDDASGRQWHRCGGLAIYFQYYACYGRMLIALSDDIGAADTKEMWNGRSEDFTFGWIANIGVSCNYLWSSFESWPCYWDGDYSNTTTDIEEIKDSFAQLANGGVYACPSNFAEFGTASIFDTIQSICGLADQAGLGTSYDPGTLYDSIQALRANTRALKYSIKKAA